jgi:hypothetical protein
MTNLSALTMGDAVPERISSHNNHGAKDAWNDRLNAFRAQQKTIDKTTSTKTFKVFTVNEGGGRPDPTTGPNAPVPQPTAGAPDKDVLPIPVDFTSSWTKLTNGTSSDQNTLIQQLGQPLNASVTIWQYWHHYNLDQFDWTQPPPASFPPELQDAIKFVQSNPALMAALKGADGKISIDSVIHFTMSARSDLMQAADDFAAWQKANPDAGPMATELARSAAFLEANNTLLGGQYSAQNLKDFASQNPGLSPSLNGAAQMWAQPGMFYFVDQAGQPDSDPHDGLVNGQNFSAFLKDIAPGTDDGAINFLNQAAERNPIANIDISNLDADVFKNPQNYSGAQKAALLQHLLDLKAEFVGGSNDDELSWQTEVDDGVNPSLLKTASDFQSKIDILEQDKDVQKFEDDNDTLSLQTIVNADPDFKAAIGNAQKNLQSGATLNDDLNAKDQNGNKVTQPVAVQTFLEQAGFFEAANGQNGQLGDKTDLIGIVKRSGHYQEFLDYYKNNIVTGGDLDNFKNAGLDGATAVDAFNKEALSYQMLLDPKDIQNLPLLDGFNQKLIGYIKPEDIEAAFGDGNGNFDEEKAKAYVEMIASANPEMGSVDKKTSIAALTFNEVRYVFSLVRNGMKVPDAYSLAKKGQNSKLSAFVRTGIAHVLSGVFGAVAIGLSFANHPSDPAQKATAAGIGIGAFGNFLNGAGKIYNWRQKVPKEVIDDLKKTEGEAEAAKVAAQAADDKATKDLAAAKVERDKAEGALSKAVEDGAPPDEVKTDQEAFAKSDNAYITARDNKEAADADLTNAEGEVAHAKADVELVERGNDLIDAKAAQEKAQRAADKAGQERKGAQDKFDAEKVVNDNAAEALKTDEAKLEKDEAALNNLGEGSSGITEEQRKHLEDTVKTDTDNVNKDKVAAAESGDRLKRDQTDLNNANNDDKVANDKRGAATKDVDTKTASLKGAADELGLSTDDTSKPWSYKAKAVAPKIVGSKLVVPAGEALSGAGSIVSGGGLLASGISDLRAGDVYRGRLEIVSGTAQLGGGALELGEGVVAAVTTSSRLLPWLSLASGALNAAGVIVSGVIGGFLLASDLKKKGTALKEQTHAVDAELLKYGITGGPITDGDIHDTKLAKYYDPGSNPPIVKEPGGAQKSDGPS